MSLSDDCPPFSEHGEKDRIAITDVLSPRLGQFRLMSKFTIYDSHQAFKRALFFPLFVVA
jgi:hypothetical protein